MTDDKLQQLEKSVALLVQRMDNEFKHMAADITTLKTDFNTIRNRLLNWMWAITFLTIASIVGLVFAIVRQMWLMKLAEAMG